MEGDIVLGIAGVLPCISRSPMHFACFGASLQRSVRLGVSGAKVGQVRNLKCPLLLHIPMLLLHKGHS